MKKKKRNYYAIFQNDQNITKIYDIFLLLALQ